MALPENRYRKLFEPVQIGPVTAPNRFYQTPHATGMGWRAPRASAALREVKAEGGWGVVATEYCSIHPSSDDSPFAYLSLWDEDDVRALAVTAEAVHRHGSLLAVELWHGGFHTNNRMTREAALSPSGQRLKLLGPGSARAMDKADIRAFLGWQGAAAERAKRAGADIVYVYAGHDYLPLQFLSPRVNRRSDEYGGSTENRTRLIREMIEVTRQATGGACAVALRFAVDELHGAEGITFDGEARDIVSLLAELPDLWDVNLAGALGNDSRSARFSEEGFQESYVAFVKSLTSKPVVGVGRFTSPETMLRQVREGVLDLIGAARPSIADPFLPVKIRDGRADEIRECIGCNICRAANNEAVPLRCTQNPTIGEEWRRGWHPQRIAGKASDRRILIVGGGPAGLEAALALGTRGYEVVLAEERRELGGRLLFEARLPGLSTWIRVRDHRQHMLSKLANVTIYRESRLTARDIVEFGADQVVLATGSRWRRDGIGVAGERPLSIASAASVATPDDLESLRDPILIYDDDNYFMGGALAEKLAREGRAVIYVTSQPIVSAWTQMTDEQYPVEARLVELGIDIRVGHVLAKVETDHAVFQTALSRESIAIAMGSLLLVTGHEPVDHLYTDLTARADAPPVTRIGDCLAPSHVADAVWSGHRFAREFDQPSIPPPRRERPQP
ncbi:MAG: FAD-dependent oxidoreductase [Rhizobiales bacterium]|nr:FAD-dependent oxidoreductase [Hyphomicrobiales bacterium]MBI3672902.1 FAD-dependent oxidoreductase [Hyphomicrobiales bacterium]